ncbi:MAG: hypothetical protein CL663_09195 [Bacteroidetes bacterium]|nr:hypothetical protein [Bacteroidota bacterium]|tara:strand:+ start:146 stop:808 length:663 start_codon:yes stop_codon:yes gene_type:complete
MLVKKIYLSWRKGHSYDRHLVGEFKRTSSQGLTFKYRKDDLNNAIKDGFLCYPDFPHTDKIYTSEDNVLELISTRLINLERLDKDRFLNFWEANDNSFDSFDVLAFTQGRLATDQFEFLGVYFPYEINSFVTEIAGLSHNLKEQNIEIEVGEELDYILDPENRYDKNAVAVFSRNGTKIGHVKKVHNRFFYHGSRYNPTITVKAINRNGVINDIFVKVSL